MLLHLKAKLEAMLKFFVNGPVLSLLTGHRPSYDRSPRLLPLPFLHRLLLLAILQLTLPSR